MTVAHDAFAGSGSWNTATAETWDHVPVGTPKGIAVLISQNGNGDQVGAVTYGGVAMRRVWYMQRTVTETCATYIYVLESGIPTGTQEVSVTSTGTLVKAARSVSVTADGDVMLAALNFNQGLAANPSLTIDAAAACELYYILASGLNTPPNTPQSGTTQLGTQDLGSISAMFGRKTSDGSSTTIGWDAASDDFSHIAFGFREATGPQVVPFKSAFDTTTSPKDVVVPACLNGDKLLVLAGGNQLFASGDVTAVTTTTQAGSTGSWTEVIEDLSDTDETWVSSAEADVTADGSVTVRMSVTTASAAQAWGFTVLRIRDHGGIGDSASSLTPGSTEAVSLAVAQDSVVASLAADWSEGAVGSTWTPADGITIERSIISGAYAVLTGYWLGQPSGTRNYGTSDSAGTAIKMLAIEVLAAGGVPDVDITPAVLAFVGVALDPVPQPVSVTLTPAVLAFVGVALDPVPQPVSVTLTPAVLSFVPVALETEFPVADVDITPAVLDFVGVALDPVPQPVSVTLTPAVLAFVGVPLDPVPQPISVTLTPAVLAFVGVPLDPVPQPVSATLTPAVLAFQAVPLETPGGPSVVTLTPASLVFVGVALDPVPQPVSVTLTPAVLSFVGVALDPEPQSVSVTLTPASMTFVGVALDPVAQAVSVTLVPAVLHFVAVPFAEAVGP
ncbi:MAG: hypothetical protein ACRD0W_00530, partial [Acidimicrobiales bacterium]